MNDQATKRAAIEAERERRAERYGDATGQLPADAPDSGIIAEGRMAAHGVFELTDEDDADNGNNDDDGELRERFDVR